MEEPFAITELGDYAKLSACYNIGSGSGSSDDFMDLSVEVLTSVVGPVLYIYRLHIHNGSVNANAHRGITGNRPNAIKCKECWYPLPGRFIATLHANHKS